MKEKPIIFSGEMVRAILEGRKTQTRRVMWPKSLQYIYRNLMEKIHVRKTPSHYLFDLHHDDGTVSTIYGIRPKYIVGDQLWVRETFSPHTGWDASTEYKADWHRLYANTNFMEPKWRPSIFMPRWASRIMLEITDVRVERVQDISEADARAEGVPPNWCGSLEGWDADEHGFLEQEKDLPPIDDYYFADAKTAFKSLWNSINAKRGFGWDANPWVWVIEFKVVEK